MDITCIASIEHFFVILSKTKYSKTWNKLKQEKQYSVWLFFYKIKFDTTILI